MGSFEVWDRVVRGAVWFATGRDCLATQRGAARVAPERQRKLALLFVWQKLPVGGADGKGVTAAQAIGWAMDQWTAEDSTFRHLREVLKEVGEKGQVITSPQLGSLLRGLKGNPIGGLTLESPGDRHKTTLWRVSGTLSDDPDRTDNPS
jgi:hypothetical protein